MEAAQLQGGFNGNDIADDRGDGDDELYGKGRQRHAERRRTATMLLTGGFLGVRSGPAVTTDTNHRRRRVRHAPVLRHERETISISASADGTRAVSTSRHDRQLHLGGALLDRRAGGGNDTITTGSGNDVLDGEFGDERSRDGGGGNDLHVDVPSGSDNADGEAGDDEYSSPTVSGIVGTATIADTGPAPATVDAAVDADTFVDLQLRGRNGQRPTQAMSRAPTSINYSGIEVPASCGFAPPPPPPPPPPPASAVLRLPPPPPSTTTASASAYLRRHLHRPSPPRPHDGRRRRALRRPEREGQDGREGEGGPEGAQVRGGNGQAGVQRQGEEGARDRAEQAARARGTRATRR